MNNMIEIISELVNNVIGEERNQITCDTPFNEIGLDSLEYMNFIIKVENTFNVEFEDEDLFFDNYEKVSDFIEKISSLKNN